MPFTSIHFSNSHFRVVAVLLVALSVTLLMFRDESADTGHEEKADLLQPADIAAEAELSRSAERYSVPSETVLPYKSKLGPLPGSLEGTIMQQSLALDEDGNLRISGDIQRIFDFFLATIEEEDLSLILQRIREYLGFHLDEPALTQSLEVMNQYVAFKKALFDFESERSESLRAMAENTSGLSSEAYLSLLEEQLQAQKDLRALHLDPQVHEAFYADEEVYDDYSLARMKIKADQSLSDADKERRLAELDVQAPAELVASRKEAQLTDILKEKTQSLKERGASASEIKALRTEMLGAEAAERFEALDQQRALWQQRLDQFLAQRQVILASEGLSEQAKLEHINQLRRSQFDEREQIRVSVYERRADHVK